MKPKFVFSRSKDDKARARSHESPQQRENRTKIDFIKAKYTYHPPEKLKRIAPYPKVIPLKHKPGILVMMSKSLPNSPSRH